MEDITRFEKCKCHTTIDLDIFDDYFLEYETLMLEANLEATIDRIILVLIMPDYDERTFEEIRDVYADSLRELILLKLKRGSI